MKLSLMQKDEIVARYLDGDTSLLLANQYGVSPQAILAILRKRGIGRRPPTETSRKYALWEDAFDVVNEESAYWVGFLMTDGCIVCDEGKPSGIKLQLAKIDESHLLRFRSFLRSAAPIRDSVSSGFGRHPQAVFRAWSSKLALSVARFGLLPQKTFTAQVVGLEHDRHFWLGVVDGDGHLGMDPHNGARIELVGSPMLLQQFANFVSEKGVAPTSIRPHKNIFRISLCGNPAQIILKELYSDVSISLERKQALAEKIIAFLPKPKTERKCTELGCGKKHYGHGLCKNHYYAIYGKEPRHQRYLAIGK